MTPEVVTYHGRGALILGTDGANATIAMACFEPQVVPLVELERVAPARGRSLTEPDWLVMGEVQYQRLHGVERDIDAVIEASGQLRMGFRGAY